MPGQTHWQGQGQSAGSPTYDYIFEVPLPVGSIAQPKYTQIVNNIPIDYYEVTIKDFDLQVYPNLGPAHLTGYNGSAPGPTFWIQKGRETIIRYLNKGSVSAAVHLHGSYSHAAWDGWAADEMQVGQFKDYYYPNTESARSIWYHDHADNHTASDAYYGQAGVYIIYDPSEDSLGLPNYNYDVPLALSDKSYQSNGDLQSPDGSVINFFGDTIHVNEQPWPYLSVEPRKYRFRLYDMSLSRAYDLYLVDPEGNWLDFEIIASDSGLFASPVKSNDLTIAMGERYEIVVDFSAYEGKNITLGNKMSSPQVNEYDNTDKVMRFVVGNSVSDDSNNGDVPSTLDPNIQWPEKRTTVDHVFNFQMGGEDTWTINGVTFNDAANRVLARPPQGTVELWEIHHAGGPALHPVHVCIPCLHLAPHSGANNTFTDPSHQPASRQPLRWLSWVVGLRSRGAEGCCAPRARRDCAGACVLWAMERSLHVSSPRSTKLLDLACANDPSRFHCHNLIHEDHAMMAAFNVTLLNELGYEFNSTTGYSDPLAAKFVAQDYNDEAYTESAIISMINAFGNLNAYAPASSLQAAESSYYATAGYNGESATGAPATTIAAVSSGYGFSASTTSEAMSGFSATATASGNARRDEPSWTTLTKQTAAP